MTITKPPRDRIALRHKSNIAATRMAVAMQVTCTQLKDRANRRARDAGLTTLEWVIIAAAVCGLALLVMAYVRPVIIRYMNQIH